MRILFLALDVDLAKRQGDTVHTIELSHFLAARGHRIDLVTTTTPTVPTPEVPGTFHHAVPPKSDWKMVREVVRIGRSAESQLIYERRLSPKIAFAAAHLLRVPYAVELNGIEEESAMLGRTHSPSLRFLRRRVRSRMYRSSAKIVAVSEQMAQTVPKDFRLDPHHVVWIPNGVDLARFVTMDPRRARQELGWPDAPTVVFVGNLVPWQGIETLIHAVGHFSPGHPGVSIRVVGDGPMRGSLETLAARVGLTDRVHFVGAVPYEAVPMCIGASTVCVAPFTRNRNEKAGLSPLKLYEYFAGGRPVVASDLPGVREMVRSSGAGILVPPDDPRELANAIAFLASSPETSDRMGVLAREYAESHFSWALTAQRVESVLDEALRGGGR
ncbi:MAG TPA: glycosyltransferase family 4 protein [Thermoplasmata archaeon]|nr:glycosyltransferase family 4 protein [Thermoplasmata archaeon]